MKERIVILGAGESGTGAALLARAKGYDVFVSDNGTVKDRYREELNSHSVAFEEGGHTEEKILNASLIVKSPGIPGTAEIVRKAKAQNIEIIDEVELAYRFVKGKIIAITGTNGKTTTTLLIYHLLKSAGYQVTLVGNVGESIARQVAQGDHEWYVLEISSFQLDGTSTFKPHIGILLNITPDHLDRYEYKFQNYIDSKFQLVRNMTREDFFICYAGDRTIKKEVQERNLSVPVIPVSLDMDSQVCFDGEAMNFTFEKEEFKLRQSDTTLKGPHNLINTMAAVSAAHLAGVGIRSILESLKTFQNAPHRLEWIATINGAVFINDSKATNVDSVVYGLGSFSNSIIWIAGGVDKGNDYTLLEEEVKKKVKALICLGKDNRKLKNAFQGIVPAIYETQDVKDLAHLALRISKEGDTILLSPACASFDLFKNYEDRGDQFRSAVLALKEESKREEV